ncbi:MAG: peroxiredoxin-like family protein [Flammeovirgaceae bacterium]
MDFQQQLAKIKHRIEDNMPPAYLDIMHQATKELQQSGIQDRVLKVGEQAPDFALLNQDGKTVSSKDLLGKGALVVTFYRGVWCPYCNADLANLKKYVSTFEGLNATLVGISPELPQYLQKIITTQRLNFDILHDDRNGLANQFGLKFFYSDALKGLYRDKFNINLEVQQGNDEWALPMPARFVIDQAGIIQYAESEPDYRNRPNPDELVSVLESLNQDYAV